MDKIILADGTEIHLVDLDTVIGCFVTNDFITKDTFRYNMSTVRVDIDGNETIYKNVYLTFFETDEVTGKSRFGFREYTESDLVQMKIRSDIDYIAMMCDVEL